MKTIFSLRSLVICCLFLRFPKDCLSGSNDSSTNSNPTNHPLDPLTADEIQKTADIIKTEKTDTWIFSAIYLHEPPKSLLAKSFMDNTDPPYIARQAFATIIDITSGHVFEVVVNLEIDEIHSFKQMPEGTIPTISQKDYATVLNIVKMDPKFLAKSRRYGFNSIDNIYFALWDVAFSDDKPNWKGKRVVQLMGFEKQFDKDNSYAQSLPFSTVFDLLNKTIIEFEDFPTKDDFSNDLTSFSKATLQHNYDQSIQNTILRNDVKPIVITTPEGVNYDIKGHQLHWQKWQMRIGFNIREGLVIYHVGYYDDDNGRSKATNFRTLFYRLSISEMWIPYGDPRPPFYRKAAFDEGHYGLGNFAIPLYAPANCKGTVHFFNGVINEADGKPLVSKNCICIYEEDSGILWTHKDEISGDNNIVRSTRLVLSFHARISNYDYVFFWYFYQDASVEFKVILSGLISPIPFHKGAKAPPYGRVVAESIVGQIHQHFFCVRVDADIDGIENGVGTVDITPVEQATGSNENPYGNGLIYGKTPLKTAGEGRSQASPTTSRVWSIQNDNVKNPISGDPISYILKTSNWPTCLMKMDSPIRSKGNFTAFTTWVTPYKDNEMFAAGKYVNNDGLSKWVEQNPKANIWNTDIVLWHVVGVTHLPRIEDWPVMPTESVGFFLKPVGFFQRNPAIDVPRTSTGEDYGSSINSN